MKEKRCEPRIVMANYNDKTVRVYQAYNHTIAEQALKLGTFGSSFKMERMTWIKPSFLWMMYRASWGTKPGQERILAIDIDRAGFDEILTNVVLSSFDNDIYGTYEWWQEKLQTSAVRCQWDPDRDIHGNPIGRRAIQLGLSGNMVDKYVHSWVREITDLSEEANSWRQAISANQFDQEVLPKESEYPVSEEIRKVLGI
jgi:hypothetical protein